MKKSSENLVEDMEMWVSANAYRDSDVVKHNNLRVSVLPEPFKSYIHNLRASGVDSINEQYYIFVCEQAVEIAKYLGNTDRILKVSSFSFEHQLWFVDLSNLHTPGTLFLSYRLAFWWLVDPEKVRKVVDIKSLKV